MLQQHVSFVCSLAVGHYVFTPSWFSMAQSGLKPLFWPRPGIGLVPLHLHSNPHFSSPIRVRTTFLPKNWKKIWFVWNLAGCFAAKLHFLKTRQVPPQRCCDTKFHSFGTWQSALQSYCWYKLDSSKTWQAALRPCCGNTFDLCGTWQIVLQPYCNKTGTTISSLQPTFQWPK